MVDRAVGLEDVPHFLLVVLVALELIDDVDDVLLVGEGDLFLAGEGLSFKLIQV